MKVVSVCVAVGLVAAGISLAGDPPALPKGSGGEGRNAMGEGKRGDREGGREKNWQRRVEERRAGGEGAEGSARGGMDRMNMGGAMIEHLLASPDAAETFGLDQNKIDQLKNKLEEQKKKTEELQVEMRNAAEEQGKLMSAEELDKKALLKAVKKTGELRTEIAKANVERLLLVRQHLSREKIEEVQQKQRERMRQRMRDRSKDKDREKQMERRRQKGDSTEKTTLEENKD